MTTVDELTRPEPKRDRWGRYLITPADGSKAVGHTRVTTFAKAVADTHNLTEWAKRNVALGMAKRPDLVAMAHGLSHSDKAAMKEVVDAADEASGANERRRIGTALHSMAERVDLAAMTLAEVPEAQRDDVAAYLEAMAAHDIGIVAEWIERVCVIPRFTIAGTFDRLVMIDGKLTVADLKTGREISYGQGEIAMQLACYANAETLWDLGSETHHPMPEVDRERALIIHVPAGEARCELHYVDIAAGWEACELAGQVRAWRKRKNLLTPLGAVSAPEVAAGPPATDERRQWVRGRVQECVGHSTKARDDLTALWPEGVPTFKAVADGKAEPHHNGQLDAIVAALDEVEGRYEIPFGAPDPDLPAPEVKQFPRPRPDEGEPLGPEAYRDIQQVVKDCDIVVRQQLNRWADEADAANKPFSLKREATERRHRIISAAVVMCRWDPTDDAARVALGIVLGEDVQPTVTVGSALGTLTIDEAQRLVEVATALEGGAAISFDSSHVPSLVA